MGRRNLWYNYANPAPGLSVGLSAAYFSPLGGSGREGRKILPLLGMLCFRNVICLPKGTRSQTEGLPCTTNVQKSQIWWLSHMLLHWSIYGEEQGPVSVCPQPRVGLPQRAREEKPWSRYLQPAAVISEVNEICLKGQLSSH